MRKTITALETMKMINNWVVWKAIKKEGRKKPIKMPINPHNGKPAKSNNPTTWGSYHSAIARYKKGGYSGLGFMFSKDAGIVGIDLDDSFIEGDIKPFHAEILMRLGSYVEYSPSGKGLHILAYGSLPSGGINTSNKLGVELYDCERYFTVTGDNFYPMDKDSEGNYLYNERLTLSNQQEGIDWLLGEIEARTPKRPVSTAPQPTTATPRGDIDIAEVKRALDYFPKWSGAGTGLDYRSQYLPVVNCLYQNLGNEGIALLVASPVGGDFDETLKTAVSLQRHSNPNTYTIGLIFDKASQHGYKAVSRTRYDVGDRVIVKGGHKRTIEAVRWPYKPLIGEWLPEYLACKAWYAEPLIQGTW